MFQFPINPVIGQQFAPAVGVTYEWNGTGWVFLGLSTASLYPAGIILPYAGNAPPIMPIPFQGWLLCDGSAVSRTTYAVLFAVISVTFGAGDGSTTFNLPDLRGRVIAGVDNMGSGTFANRLTAATLGTSGTINAQGGAEQVALTAAQAPAHSHGVTDAGHAHGVPDPGHAHSVSDPGHAHGVTDPTHAHSVSDPGHTHPIDGAATAIASGGFMAETNNSAGAVGHTNSAATGVGVNAGGTGVSVNAAGTNVGVVGNLTGIGNTTGNATGLTVNSAGGGAAHLNVQPTLCLNYLIKT